jgi:hypothetical protein
MSGLSALAAHSHASRFADSGVRLRVGRMIESVNGFG